MAIPKPRRSRMLTKIIGLAMLVGVPIVTTLGASVGAVPPGTIPFGAYDPSGDFSEERDFLIEHVFLPWEDVALASLVQADRYAAARNRALLLTLEPWTWSRSERNTPENLQAGIYRGDYDATIKATCDVIGTLKSPVTLRWGHEMDKKNGPFIWSGWSAPDYIRAYRRVTDICRASAPKINLMWSPLGDAGMQAYYPGDAYVDLIGLSVFGLQAWDRALYKRDRSFAEILRPRYARAVAFGKPVVVAELGYSGSAEYVQAWDAQVRSMAKDFPDLVGVVYFNHPEVHAWPGGFGLPDWRIGGRVVDASG